MTFLCFKLEFLFFGDMGLYVYNVDGGGKNMGILILGLLDCIWDDFKFEIMAMYVRQVFVVGVECRGFVFVVVWEF